MKLRVLSAAVLIAATLLSWRSLTADEYPRDPRVDVLGYVFSLELDDASDEIRGQADIKIHFTEAGVESITLDLVGDGRGGGMSVESVTLGGAELDHQHDQDRLQVLLPHPSVGGDTMTLRVVYRGVPVDGLIIGSNKYGERTFFGDNWPNRAHHWLPTVDHVSDKALVDFIVTAPNHYQVVANGRLVEKTDLPQGRRRTHWSCAVPLPPKVMVIGAARFAVQHLAPVNGIPVQSWVYPQDREAGFFDFKQARDVLAFFDARIGEYPYSKLANVQSTTRYGGMENAGNIFYNERAIRGDGSNEGLIAHEIAHQWFGDSVTEADWHHVWLSEGFATYFTALYLEHAHGRAALVEQMLAARQTVLRYHQQAPHSPVIDESITDLNALLNRNSYQKGGWVLHMLRREVGDEVFWKGIRAYYRRYGDRNALSSDFRRVMEREAGRKLEWFFRQWLSTPGQPAIRGAWHYNATDGELIITIEQVQPGEALFRATLDIGIELPDGGSRLETLLLHERRHEMRIALPAAPSEVTLDPQTWLLFSDAGFGPRD